MSQDICEQHIQLASDIAVIKNSIKNIEEGITKHINEAESRGGYRDRLIILEQEVSVIKKMMWIRVSIAGIIGGLIGSGSADAISLLIKWMIGK